MSYLVLARKWRPKNFDDIVGQDYITQTLKNAVSSGKTAHAFIFSGPRGVGKTSTARIVAKALNCESGPTADPCSNCSFCTEISEGKSLDVIEIDAASHTGVNDVREIIENIKYLPTSGKNKIYIIDEAHMLSQSAFNALLKTLEEPPPHVLFILATTEVHKIPVTILSRCQRYDFKRVTAEEIRAHLKQVTSNEGVKIDDETLYLVSQEADGSVRDSLSLMDQLIATFGNDIKHDEAIAILGILDKALIKSVLKSILENDPKSSIDALKNAIDKGISPKRFSEDLLKTLRDAVIIKTCGRSAITELSDEDIADIESLISNVNEETLESLFNLMLVEAENIQKSFYPQMALELNLIKLSTLKRILPIEDILERIDSLKQAGPSSYGSSRRMDEHQRDYSPKVPKEDRKEAIKENSSKENKHSKTDSTTKNSSHGQEPKGNFIDYIKSNKRILGTRLEQALDISIEGSRIRVVCGKDSPVSAYLKKAESKEALIKFGTEFYGSEMKVDIEESQAPEKKTNEVSKKERKAANKKKIHDDPIVKEAEEIFGGRVIDVKPN